MQKVESIVTYSGCKITIKKRTDLSLCVYTQWKSMKRWRVLMYRIISKQQVENEQLKREKNLSVL